MLCIDLSCLCLVIQGWPDPGCWAILILETELAVRGNSSQFAPNSLLIWRENSNELLYGFSGSAKRRAPNPTRRPKRSSWRMSGLPSCCRCVDVIYLDGWVLGLVNLCSDVSELIVLDICSDNQGDHSACVKPPCDIKTKFPF